MAEVSELLKAVSALAWPLVFLAVALAFRRPIFRMMSRDHVSLKVAGMELSVADAAEQVGKNLADLTERVAQVEAYWKAAAGRRPVEPLPTLSPAEPRSAADASILWVDDIPMNNAFLIQKFEQEGFYVQKEISTRSAIAAWERRSFDLVISVLGRRENGVDNPFAGLDLVKALRARGATVPILIFAGPRGLRNREDLLAAGATEVTASAVDVFKFVSERRAAH